MPHRRILAAVLSGSLVVAALLLRQPVQPARGFAEPAAETPAAALATQMQQAAEKLLAGLPPELRARTHLAFDHPQRLVWHYYPRVPWTRTGVTLKELNAEQKKLYFDLVRAGTSETGFETAVNLMKLEAILRDIENTPLARELRDPERFHITIFGKPGKTGRWSWKLEGHHLVLHYLIENGQVVAATPFVFGANPGRVPSGPERGARLLPKQEDLGRQLFTSLSPTLRDKARFAVEPPFDVLTNVYRQAPRLPAVGITHAEMNAEQRQLVLEILKVYTGLLPDAVNERLIRAVTAAGLDPVRFTWAGAAEPGMPHYYRVQGPKFVVEYCNTQNNGNHIHVVWRDYENDFGETAE
jgi:hypothetical protein